MKINLRKPNKSSKNWELQMWNPLGIYANIEPKCKFVGIVLTKKQLEQLKRFFMEGENGN